MTTMSAVINHDFTQSGIRSVRRMDKINMRQCVVCVEIHHRELKVFASHCNDVWYYPPTRL